MLDSSQITIYAESDEESDEEKSESIDDGEATLVNEPESIDGTIEEETITNQDEVTAFFLASSPDFGTMTSSNSFEHDSLNGSLDSTEYFTMESSTKCYDDSVFPSTTVDSGRASLSTTAIKRLSEENLRTISPITNDQAPDTPNENYHTPTDNTIDTVIEEEEENATLSANSSHHVQCSKEEILKNFQLLHETTLGQMETTLAADEDFYLELMKLNHKFLSELTSSRLTFRDKTIKDKSLLTDN